MTLSVHISHKQPHVLPSGDSLEFDFCLFTLMTSLIIFCSGYIFPKKKKLKISFHISKEKTPPQMHLPEQSSPDLTSVKHRFRNCHPLKKPMPQTVAGKHRLSSMGNTVLSPGIFLGKREKKSCASKATQPTRLLQG